MFFLLRAPKNQLHFKSLCIPETTKKKKKYRLSFYEVLMIQGFPKRLLQGCFFIFSIWAWRHEATLWGRCCVGKIFTAKPAVQKQHAAAISGAQSPESTRCSCRRQQPSSTRPRVRKCDRSPHRGTRRTTDNEECVVDAVGAAEDPAPHTAQATKPRLRQLWGRTDRADMM